MNYKLILPIAILLNPLNALAEVGDVHTVKVDSATVYEEPDRGATAIENLPKGTEIMEMDTRGDWHEIYVADTDLGGWMHRNDMQILGGGQAEVVAAEAAVVEKPSAPARPEGVDPTSAVIALQTSGAKSEKIQKFEKYLLKYNSRTLELKGYVPFSGASDDGQGKLTLTVSNKWLDKPKARQKTSLIRVFSKWKRASGATESTVEAIDRSGNTVISYP